MTNTVPQRHRKMPLNHSSPLNRRGLFPLKYWVQAVTGHARHFLGRWQVTPRMGYGPWENRQSGWKQDTCENCSFKACLVHHSAQRRLWHQGCEIIPMVVSLFKTVPTNMACFSVLVCKIELNKVIELHHYRRKSNSPSVQHIPAPDTKSTQFTCLIWLFPCTKLIFFFISIQFTKILNKIKK